LGPFQAVVFVGTMSGALSGQKMRRRELITLVGGLVATWPLAAYAQEAPKIPQIGVLSGGRGDRTDASLTTIDAFIPALRELGYIEGQNIAFDRKFADGDANRLSALAQELVERKVDAIVVLATPAARAAKRATSAIPIVAIGMADPVGDELVSSLARPGGNVTGTTFLGPELVSKRLQLLKELVPHLARVVVLWHPQAYGERTMAGMFKEIESAAQSMGIKLRNLPVISPAELDGAFAAIATEPADGLIVFPSPMLFSQYARIATLATNNHLPAMYAAREAVAFGGLVSYGVNLPDLSRATAVYLDRILKGAKPSELPVQQPTKFELVINLRAAKALGLTISRDFLLIADEVVE
jgi:putative ABC transport system substrate-binding protein